MEFLLVLAIFVVPLGIFSALIARFIGTVGVWGSYAVGACFICWKIYETMFARNGTFMEIEIPMTIIMIATLAIWAWWSRFCLRKFRRS